MPIESIRIEGSPEPDVKKISRELCVKEVVSISIKITSQSVLDRLIRALIREGVSIFAADNRDDIVILYLARRDKKGCI